MDVVAHVPVAVVWVAQEAVEVVVVDAKAHVEVHVQAQAGNIET